MNHVDEDAMDEVLPCRLGGRCLCVGLPPRQRQVLHGLLSAEKEAAAMLRRRLNPPTATFADSGQIEEGGSGDLSFTNVVGTGPLTYEYSFNDDGNFITGGPTAAIPASYLVDGPATFTMEGRISNSYGYTDYTTTVEVKNVAPTPTISGGAPPYTAGTPVNLVGNYTDPGTQDTVTLDWSVTKDGTPFGSTGTGNNYSFTPDGNGTFIASLLATDNDGGSNVASQTITIGTTTGGGGGGGGTNQPPTIATRAASSDQTATSVDLSVLAADDGGESNLKYTWTAVGTVPAPVTFSDNDDNSAKNTTVTFTTAGTYTFAVVATDAEGLSSSPSKVVVEPSGSPGPTGLYGIADTDGSVYLFWDTSTDPSVTYEVLRSTTLSALNSGLSPLASGLPNASYHDTQGLLPDTVYYYAVMTVTQHGVSSDLSETTNCTTSAPSGAPSTPTNFWATLNPNGSVTMTWQNSSTTQTSVSIEQQIGASGSPSIVTVLPGGATSFTAPASSDQQDLSYIIEASNSSGASAPSTPVSAANTTTPTTKNDFLALALMHANVDPSQWNTTTNTQFYNSEYPNANTLIVNKVYDYYKWLYNQDSQSSEVHRFEWLG